MLQQRCVISYLFQWLRAEGLPQCQRIKCTLYVDGLTRYEYAPPLPCRTQDKLIEFLKKRRKESGTGSLKEDILLSVPNAERVLQVKLGAPYRIMNNDSVQKHLLLLILQVIRDEICIFSRHDQKEVVFYSPKNERVETVPALTNLVPEVSVFAINDEKVDGILEDGGFFISQPSNCDAKKRSSDVRVSRRSRGVKRSAFKHNSHVNSLQLYS